MTESRELTPKVPDLEEIDQTQVRVSYNRLADTLWVSLVGEPKPAVSVYVDDDTIFRVDPYPEEVIGFEIENFLERTLQTSANSYGFTAPAVPSAMRGASISSSVRLVPVLEPVSSSNPRQRPRQPQDDRFDRARWHPRDAAAELVPAGGVGGREGARRDGDPGRGRRKEVPSDDAAVTPVAASESTARARKRRRLRSASGRSLPTW